MKFTTTGVTLGHKLFIRERVTLFDKKKLDRNHTIENYVDHTKMKSHEFAAFQKRMFYQRKKDRKKRRVILLITFIITLFIVIGFLLFWKTFDFDLWKSSEF